RAWRAVDTKPPRRRSSESARSAVRDASTFRTAVSEPSGSITTANVERAEPSRRGARKSLRTSIRGHSDTQKVACTMPSTRTLDQLSSIAIGHGSSADAEADADADAGTDPADAPGAPAS